MLYKSAYWQMQFHSAFHEWQLRVAFATMQFIIAYLISNYRDVVTRTPMRAFTAPLQRYLRITYFTYAYLVKSRNRGVEACVGAPVENRAVHLLPDREGICFETADINELK